jgi:hypothetical protein
MFEREGTEELRRHGRIERTDLRFDLKEVRHVTGLLNSKRTYFSFLVCILCNKKSVASGGRGFIRGVFSHLLQSLEK